MFTLWFTERTADEVTAALSQTSVLWDRYRTFAEVAADPRVTDNPLFSPLDQPRIGRHLAAGLPISIDGGYPPAVPAPALGDHTTAVLTDLGLTGDEIDGLFGSGTVA